MCPPRSQYDEDETGAVRSSPISSAATAAEMVRKRSRRMPGMDHIGAVHSELELAWFKKRHTRSRSSCKDCRSSAATREGAAGRDPDRCGIPAAGLPVTML